MFKEKITFNLPNPAAENLPKKADIVNVPNSTYPGLYLTFKQVYCTLQLSR